MKNLLDKFRPVFAPDDGGAGGAGSAAAEGAPAGAAAAVEGGAAAAGASGDAAAPYRPDGLPDTMYGLNDRETMDKMHEALKGYRTRDAERQVPADPAAYRAFDLSATAAEIKPHIEHFLGNQALFDPVAAVAKEHGVSVKTLQALTEAVHAAGHKAGAFTDLIDEAAEQAALIPAGYENRPKAEQEKAVDARLKANEDFVNLLAKNSLGEDGKLKAGGLSQEAAEHAICMLGGEAKGNFFLEHVQSLLTAGGAQPMGGGGNANGDTREALKAEMAKPEMQPGHPGFKREAHDALLARYRALIPDKAQ